MSITVGKCPGCGRPIWYVTRVGAGRRFQLDPVEDLIDGTIAVRTSSRWGPVARMLTHPDEELQPGERLYRAHRATCGLSPRAIPSQRDGTDR